MKYRVTAECDRLICARWGMPKPLYTLAANKTTLGWLRKYE